MVMLAATGRSVNNNQIDKILALLTLTVLIDDKIHPSEVNAIGRQFNLIHKYLEADFKITPKMGIDWFHDNKTQISSILSGPKRNDYIRKLLTDLADHPQKTRIYDAIIRIAYSDAEFHKTENELVKQASKIWGV